MQEMDLATPTLRLRLMRAEDAALYRALYTCPRVMAQIATPLTPAEADDGFARVCAHNRRPTSGNRAWAIHDATRAVPYGMLALHREGVNGEIGLMLLARAWAPDVARESIAAALAYAFGVAMLETIWADCRDGPNARALRRLLEPFGFVRVPPRRAGNAEWCIRRGVWASVGATPYPVAFVPHAE